MSIWTILCLIPIALLTLLLIGVGLILAYEDMVLRFESYLKRNGRKTLGIIVEAERYRGDGLHPADDCFKGKFEFTDHRGKQHLGKFSRYCFEPYDFADFEYSFQDAVVTYGKGAIIDVYYLSWFPAIHIESIPWRKKTD